MFHLSIDGLNCITQRGSCEADSMTYPQRGLSLQSTCSDHQQDVLSVEPVQSSTALPRNSTSEKCWRPAFRTQGTQHLVVHVCYIGRCPHSLLFNTQAAYVLKASFWAADTSHSRICPPETDTVSDSLACMQPSGVTLLPHTRHTCPLLCCSCGSQAATSRRRYEQCQTHAIDGTPGSCNRTPAKSKHNGLCSLLYLHLCANCTLQEPACGK